MWPFAALAAGPPAIVGGAPVVAGDWEPTAALFTGVGFACTGTVVGPRHVLTAGHCAFGLVEVRTGTADLGPGGPSFGVASVTQHPDPYLTLDLAIVELDGDTTTEPAVLARGCLDPLYEDGGDVVIVGFGATDERAMDWPETLQSAATTITDADCSEDGRGCVRAGEELIAGGDGVDSCAGDSGGPMYAARTERAPVLVGITSRAALPTTRPCGDGGIYVRADAAAAWLGELGVPLRTTECDNAQPAFVGDATVTLPRGGSLLLDGLFDDPDADPVEIEVAPIGGGVTAEVAGDVVWLRAAWNAPLGSLDAQVRASDAGVPSLEAEGVFTVRVTGTERARGCATGPGAGALACLIAAVSAATRRGPGARRRAGSSARRAT